MGWRRSSTELYLLEWSGVEEGSGGGWSDADVMWVDLLPQRRQEAKRSRRVIIARETST